MIIIIYHLSIIIQAAGRRKISVCLNKLKIACLCLLFVMERPAAVLAAVELALLVDGVIDQVKRRPLSAFGADNAVAFSFFFRHHAWCFYCFCLHHSIIILHTFLLSQVEKDKANLQNFSHFCKSKTPSDAFFVNSSTFL